MRHLIFMRHAEAGMPPIGAPDKERPLTMRGQQDAVTQAKHLIEHRIIPDKLLCSNAKRTCATWDMIKSQIANNLPLDFSEHRLDALYNAPADRLMQHLIQCDENIDVLMVIAHNPGIHEISQTLSTPMKGDSHSSLAMELQMGFPPASMAIFEIDSLGWHDVSHKTARLIQLFKV